MRLSLTVNGESREAKDVWEGESLLYVLRERHGLPGSKNACEQGECGSCSVYLDGTLVCACLVMAGQAEGREIVTVEGLAGEEDALHRLREDPRRGPAGRRADERSGDERQRGRMSALVLEGCAIATVDAAGTEHADGHLVIEDGRIAAIGEGTTTHDGTKIDGRGCLATP